MGECKEEQCEDKNKCSTGCEMTDEMMCLANQAWADLMKEKMKVHFEKINGPKMDKVAKVCVEMCMGYWQHKMSGKAQCEEHKEKIKNAFMSE